MKLLAIKVVQSSFVLCEKQEGSMIIWWMWWYKIIWQYKSSSGKQEKNVTKTDVWFHIILYFIVEHIQFFTLSAGGALMLSLPFKGWLAALPGTVQKRCNCLFYHPLRASPEPQQSTIVPCGWYFPPSYLFYLRTFYENFKFHRVEMQLNIQSGWHVCVLFCSFL